MKKCNDDKLYSLVYTNSLCFKQNSLTFSMFGEKKKVFMDVREAQPLLLGP